jgi:cyclic-di-GMP-binding protein
MPLRSPSCGGETQYPILTSLGQPLAGTPDRFGTMGRSNIVEWSSKVAAESSFDIVSKVDRQEVDNALNQAAKEVRQRFDFKNTDASISWSGQAIDMEASSEERVKAVLDVFQSKLIRRGVSLKALDAGAPRSSGKLYKITANMKEGISQENAKKVSKLIRDQGPKGVKAQIQGDELRVSSKSRDDLQKVQALIKAADYDFAVQFTNYR